MTTSPRDYPVAIPGTLVAITAERRSQSHQFTRSQSSEYAIERDQRLQFLAAAIELAESKGFSSEQGIASYVLALWYLDIDFAEKSEELASLLASSLPEVRRVHAMNQWVEALLGEPDNIAAADEALKKALHLTEPWGN